MDRIATLISAARSENPDKLLLDDGDVIQGTLLGDFQTTAQPIVCSGTLAIDKVMNRLKFDSARVGNQEFTDGLSFLSQVLNTDLGIAGIFRPANCGAPNFPTVASHVNRVSQQPILKP